MNIYNLIGIIQEKKKLNNLQIIEILSDAVSGNTEETELFRKLYIEAFGYTVPEIIAFDLVQNMPGGEKFSFQQTKAYASMTGATGPEVAPAEYYLVMNNLYAQYSATIKKYCEEDPIIYAELARDWFQNADIDKAFNHFIL